MQYFRNFEIANLYHVSQSGVAKWIAAARSGKLDLQIHEQAGRYYIANTAQNLATIETLVKSNKKYVNTRSMKAITPKPQFYELFNPRQVVDIISNLSTYREIPLQYTYFDGGADHWAEYAERLAKEDVPNVLNRNIQLLGTNMNNVLRLLGDHKRVNVIDLGIGNCLPVKEFLGSLLERGVLQKYIGIDLSQDMLKIAERNLKQWFGNKFKVETYIRDISREGFDDLLVDDYFTEDVEQPFNIVLLFGGTLNNLRSPNDTLRLINQSMAADDLLIYFMKLDTPNSRRFFVPFVRHRMPLEWLGIESSWYEIEGYYDDFQNARFMRIRLNVALSITFELEAGQRRVEINRGETILVWRYWHQNALDVISQLDRTGFDVLESTKSKDHEYLLTISEIKTGR